MFSLEKIQRKGLALCLGVPGTAGLIALEVEAGVKPLELRREELAIRQAAKENDTCINKAWNTYTESELMERKISPFGKMNIQIADMISNTGISFIVLKKNSLFLKHYNQVKDSQSTGKTSDHPNQELKIKKPSLEK